MNIWTLESENVGLNLAVSGNEIWLSIFSISAGYGGDD